VLASLLVADLGENTAKIACNEHIRGKAPKDARAVNEGGEVKRLVRKAAASICLAWCVSPHRKEGLTVAVAALKMVQRQIVHLQALLKSPLHIPCPNTNTHMHTCNNDDGVTHDRPTVVGGRRGGGKSPRALSLSAKKHRGGISGVLVLGGLDLRQDTEQGRGARTRSGVSVTDSVRAAACAATDTATRTAPHAATRAQSRSTGAAALAGAAGSMGELRRSARGKGGGGGGGGKKFPTRKRGEKRGRQPC